MPCSRKADNASRNFKCSNCGNMFSLAVGENKCPVCGYDCTREVCRELDASDEDY
ncbi:MAG TPA: hypothetical protein GX711_08885 [Clostridia bacterium]|nr:hypothetical protein [Clostridia bacterium]